ncbi:MAG: hypothetical protein [Microviridae sp.]|nr:MAG: hypothetical protein [Microviridae sp.]
MKTLLNNLVGRFSRTRQPEENDGVGIEITPLQQRPLTIQEMMARYVRQLSAQAEQEGEESFEEADDFEEEDPDYIPITHHQVVAMSDDELRGVAAAYGIEVNDPQAPQEARRGASADPATDSREGTKGLPATSAP